MRGGGGSGERTTPRVASSRGGGGGGDDDRPPPYSSSSRRGGSGSGSGKRRARSRSHGGDDDRRGGGGGGRSSSHRGMSSSTSSSSSSSQGRVKSHPSQMYAADAMLCQFLWKRELEEAERASTIGKSNDGPREGGENDVVADADGGMPNLPPPPPSLFESPDAEDAAYREYDTKYCLNYVRTFFNRHLDDPWFRVRLSPLEAVRQAARERKRASAEAGEMRREITQSLEDTASGVIPKKDPDSPEYLGPPKCSFVSGCRLGVGTKPTSVASGHPHHHQYHQREYHDRQLHGPNDTDAQQQHHQIILQGEDRNRIERHAKSHLHSFIRGEGCVKIADVPPNVSDAQLLATIAEYCPPGDMPPTAVWSDSVRVPVRDGDADMGPYHRVSYAVFPSSGARDAMLEGLANANGVLDRHHNNNRDHHDRGGGGVGQRHRGNGDVASLPRTLDLVVDCTDVYGRREIDADGRGGAPPSSSEKKKKDDNATRLPTKRCTVYVSTSLLASSQPVSVLSAALSSRERISRDKEDTTKISGILDEVRGIEAGNRLADLLRLLYPGNELLSVDDEDILDISIAYLRRVHLFSFYNGCTAASDVGKVLSYSHPAGTIHLRLRGADEILAKAAEERSNVYAAAMKDDGETTLASPEIETDMLVKRLNDSIAKALEGVQILAQRGPSCLIDPETDAAARKIEMAEQASRQGWIENHSVQDKDGRARCSFHFCHKLFKDRAFLHKHLLKKHSDQLRAECAKCHDGPMMAAWDRDDHRPVPPVLVDCGSTFGLLPSQITGSDSPFANDPEPELWREEQQRLAEVEWERREREAAARAAAEEEEEMSRRREQANTGEKRKSNFVDPDDMVEEKVELSFENVVVAPPPKKKKKKKSLL